MRFKRMGILLASAAIASVAFGSGASAAQSQTIGIRPATGDVFRLDAAPGEMVEQQVLITNRTTERTHVLVYPVDALVTPQGGFALRERNETSTGIGKWTSLDARSVTLEANAESRMRFRLSVPKDAEPGDYAGGIAVERDPRIGSSNTVGNNLAVQFNVVERVGVRIYLHVSGIPRKSVSTGALTWQRMKGGIEFSLPIRNSGNVRIAPQGRLDVKGIGVDARTIAFSEPELLLPGSEYTLKAVWKHSGSFVWGTATASIDFGAEQPATATTSIHIVPVGLIAASALALALLLLAVRAIVRFVRKAKRAMRLVEPVVLTHPAVARIPEPQPATEERDPNLAWLDYAARMDADDEAAANG